MKLTPRMWNTIIFGLAGLVAIGLGIANYFQEKEIFAKYEPATATLVEWKPDPNYGSPDYCPLYEYTTRQGDTRSFLGESCEGKPDPATIGTQTREIYYDPSSPYSPVETRGWFGSEGSGLIGGGLFFVFFEGMAFVPVWIESLKRSLARRK